MHRREFDVFLSYAHADRTFVTRLAEFLREAGLAIFLDDTSLEGGADFPQALQQGIERSRSIVVVATKDSIEQGWVKREVNIAIDENARDEAFRVIPIRIADAPVGDLIRGTSWISVPAPELTAEAAFAILRSFYSSESRPSPSGSRDLYVSASWRGADDASANLVSRYLVEQGFRLIGDSRDQDGFGDDRVERIIESCGAFACILPFRDQISDASAAESPYKYFLREIDLAKRLGLPSVVIADPSVTRVDGPDEDWLRMSTQADDIPHEVSNKLDEMWDEWRPSSMPHYIFIALDLESPAAPSGSPERRLVELVTGLPTVVGDEVNHDPIQHGIMTTIANAHLVIADIGGDSDDSFNLDASIEAGMALAYGSNLRLLARGRQRRPPFMLRTVQMPTYDGDVGRLARLHAISRSFRRRVINAEL